MTLSLETLELLRRVLGAQQLQIGDPSFAGAAENAVKALTELDDAIEEATKEK